MATMINKYVVIADKTATDKLLLKTVVLDSGAIVSPLSKLGSAQRFRNILYKSAICKEPYQIDGGKLWCNQMFSNDSYASKLLWNYHR